MSEQSSNKDSFSIELAKNLFSIESLVSKQQFVYPAEKFITAIAICWEFVREYSASSDRILDACFLSSLHKRLASYIDALEAGKFVDAGEPISWSCFAEEFDESDEENISCGGDAWIISQLFWGGHLPNLQLSVGWLCVNALRLKYKYHPIYPPKHLHKKFIEYLEFSGPDCWDAESLRALMGEIENELVKIDT